MPESNFVDYVKIYCRSGKGGAGSAHFRREKYIPRGGPDGGDGPVDQQDVGGVLPVGADTGQQGGAHSWFPSSASRR